METIFYSWQSDIRANKDFIFGALKKCVEEINQERELEFSIDSDARSTVGTKDITNELFEKIEKARIIVADASIIGDNIFKDKNKEPKKLPNPNVMIELGYAAGFKSWDNIIVVMNTNNNRFEDLPFDINRRTIINFKTTTKNADNKLKEKLKERIYNILDNSTSSNKIRPHQQVLQCLTTEGDNSLLSDESVECKPEGVITLSINGQGALIGDGQKSQSCYFSADNGQTARYLNDIDLNDKLYWNSLVAGYIIEPSDEVVLNYNTYEVI